MITFRFAHSSATPHPGHGSGDHRSVLINSAIRGARRRAAILATAGEIADGEDAELDPTEAYLVRVVEYDVPGREGNGTAS